MKNKLIIFIFLFCVVKASAQWTDITSTTGVFSSTTNMGRINVFDLNNDNFPDILVPVLTTSASPYTKYWRLYKNNGNNTFTDATVNFGLPTNLTSTLGFIDYNGDGFKDLYFYTATGLQIFKNNNGTSFTDISTQLGIISAFFTSGEITSSFKVFDYDIDGDEDLLYTRTVSGANTLTAIVNNGISFSTKVNILTSIPGATTGGINFSFFDMDNDGDFEIVFDAFAGTWQYSNGITTLYRKDAAGYTNITSTSGLVNGLPGEISTIDINQDGNLDIVKGGADCCTSPLYRVLIGNGAGVFTDQTSTYAISNGGYKYLPTLIDFDNDTDFDFSWSGYTSTGVAPFRLYANNNNLFAETASTYGLNLGVTSGGVPIDDVGNGIWMDLDKDGDLDIVLNREGWGSTSTTGNVWIKRNPIQGNYINIKLNGCGVNKSGIGAKIKLVVGANTKWLYYGNSPDGNPSNGTDTFHFGLGTANAINAITVYWPNNTTTILNNVKANQFLTIGGGAGGSSAPTGSASQTLCSGSTVANLSLTGTAIQWYTTATGGTALASTTALVNGTTYYASQTVSGCESATRFTVTVTLNNPTLSASSTAVCSGQATILTASAGGSSSSTCTNFTNALNQGLKAWYPFCGNANDVSGNNLNGNVSGAQLSTDRFGNINSAYSFSDNQQITIPGTESQNHYPLTISLWYNPSNHPAGGQTNVFSKYVAASWNGFQVLYGDNTNIPNSGTTVNNGFGTQSWYARNISNRVIGYYSSPGFLQSNVNLNTWYHYVFVLDSTGGKIYINGQLISTDAWDGTPAVSTNNYLWKIGGQYEGNFWYNGKIDDIGVWNRTLTQSEIQQLYNLSSTSYLWSTGATTASVSVNPATTTPYWVDVTTNGVTCRKNITITVNSNTAPTGSATQTLCSGSTIANLTATGTNIKWYSTSNGGTALASTTALINGTTYYASQTVNDCESGTRLAVIVSLNNPTVSASVTTVCSGQPTTLTASDGNIQQPLSNKIAQFSNNISNTIALNYPSPVPTSNFSYDFWFNTSRTITLISEKTGGVSVQAINGQNFVVFPSQPRGSGISVGTNGISVIEHSPYFFDSRFTQQINLTGWHHCAVVYTGNNFSLYIDGVLIGTRNNGSNFGGFGNTYSNVTLTQSIGEGYPGYDANDNYTGKIDEYRQWNVSLTVNQVQQIFNRKLLSNNMSECNVNLTFDQNNITNSSNIISAVSITNSNLPTFSADNSFLIGGFVGSSIGSIINTNFSGTSSTSYLWSTGATTVSISVNPATTTPYWVDVTTNGVTCRKLITITVNSTTPAPTGANNQTMTQGSTLANLVVTGQNIVWYSTPFGGTPLPANTPLVSGVTYYASQTINGCESQFRLPVIVQVTLSNEEFETIKIVYNPNPVIDILYIKASTELKNAKICNVLGQTIFQQRFKSNEIQLNMSDFPTGTYFVKVESDDRKETFKILKR